MRIEVVNLCRSEFDSNDVYFQQSIQALTDQGFELEVLPSFSSPESRAHQFEELASKKDIDFIWTARGGIETAYLLPHVDFNRISVENTFIGSSDFTHLAIPILSRGATVLYGSGIRDLSKNLTTDEIATLTQQLKQGVDNSGLPINLVNNKSVDTDHLVGGTLQILFNLMNTAYAPELNGKNVFVEHHYIPGEGHDEAKYWLNLIKLKPSELQGKSYQMPNEWITEANNMEKSQEYNLKMLG